MNIGKSHHTPILLNLKNVFLGVDNPKDPACIKLENMATFLAMPSIERISVQKPNFSKSLQRCCPVSPRSSNVNAIELCYCKIRPADLKSLQILLAAPRTLNTFSFRWPLHAIFDARFPMDVVLSQAQFSLENLTLCGGIRPTLLEDMRRFDRLRFLEIDLYLLSRLSYGNLRRQELLPQSLEHLRAHQDDVFDVNECLEDLTQLISFQKDILPKLYRLDLHLVDVATTSRDAPTLADQKLLIDLAKKCNVGTIAYRERYWSNPCAVPSD